MKILFPSSRRVVMTERKKRGLNRPASKEQSRGGEDCLALVWRSEKKRGKTYERVTSLKERGLLMLESPKSGGGRSIFPRGVLHIGYLGEFPPKSRRRKEEGPLPSL